MNKATSRSSFLLLLIAVFVTDAYAQGRPGGGMQGRFQQTPAGEISGTVVDAATSDPIATATIAIWNAADSTLATGAVSDDDGTFQIESLRPGSYYVKISFVGYATQTIDDVTLTRETPKVTLDTVRMDTDTALMAEVQVTAEREDIEFAIDRTVYNTKNQIASVGGSATDVLQNIPSVEVDVDGKVSLRGNQNVAIYLNGKPAPIRGDFLATFLQQIPSSSIERVEVIPNPSAKYDPDGMAGILNIVLKKDADLGLSGALTLGLGTQDKYNASGSVTYQKGKLTLFTNYGFRYEDRGSEGYNFRENRFLDPLSFVEQDNDGLRNSLSNLVNASADYALSDKNTLSASALVSLRDGESEDLNAYALLGTSQDPTGRYDRLTNNESDDFSMDYSLSFKRAIDPGKHELTAEVRFDRSSGDRYDTFNQQVLTLAGAPADATPDLQTNELDTREDDWTAQVDYTRPLGKLKIETGYKGVLRQIDNDFFSASFDYGQNTFMPDVNLNNTFTYDDQVHAGYGIASGNLGKFELQGGVRLEQALTTFDLTTTNETFENNYFSVFPSAFVSYKLTPQRQVKVSYSKRIQRPRTRMLNPFTTFRDPLNLFVGNPSLKPEYIHAVELAFQQFTRKGSLSITPYFRRTIDKMQRFKTVDANGISTLTFRNFDNSDSYGAEVVGTLRLGKKLSGFASFNAYRVVTDGSSVDTDLANDAVSWSTRMNATLNVRQGLDVQFFYFYRAPIDVAQGRISSFSVANLAVKQSLLNDKASLSLRLSDPLNRMGFRFEVDDDTFYQLGERKWESRIAYLTFTYNFGKQPRQSRRGNRPQEDRGGFDDVGIN